MNVVITFRPVCWTKRRRAEEAFWRTTPLPARITGRSACWSSSAARCSSPATGSTIGGGRRGTGRPVIGVSITSSGSSRWVAPGFSRSATANALRTASGMIAGSWTRAFHFVTGFIIRTTSMYWWLSLCISERLVCPVSATTGARSRNASASPVTRLVAPGPSVPRQTPAWPVRRP